MTMQHDLQALWGRAQAHGWTSESLGDAIWPEMHCPRRGKQPAGQRFRECLSPEKGRWFRPDDVVALCTTLDDWGPLLGPIERAGYERPARQPEPVRRDQLARLLRDMDLRHTAERDELRALIEACPEAAARVVRFARLRVVG